MPEEEGKEGHIRVGRQWGKRPLAKRGRATGGAVGPCPWAGLGWGSLPILPARDPMEHRRKG